MAQNDDDGFWAEYKAKCTQPSCPGELKFNHPRSAGLVFGAVINHDPTVPGFGRCPHCRRYQMKIIEVPNPQPIAGPKGFVKIPNK